MVEESNIDRIVCKILIIEDDRDDAYLLKRALNAAAAERNIALGLTHVVNGLDALGSVARSDVLNHLPDVIVVDLNMPLVDGDRFLGALREDLLLRATPAAVLTTSTEQPVHARALASGANVVFCKPDTQDELVEIARRILDMGAPAIVQTGA
jgi:CheY-like chemotaxis protein